MRCDHSCEEEVKIRGVGRVLTRRPSLRRFRPSRLVGVRRMLTAKVCEILQRRRQSSAHKNRRVLLSSCTERALRESYE
eukprot:5704765-Pleurochrysis_carterae.AAC.2